MVVVLSSAVIGDGVHHSLSINSISRIFKKRIIKKQTWGSRHNTSRASVAAAGAVGTVAHCCCGGWYSVEVVVVVFGHVNVVMTHWHW